ncbi:MAG TPA: FMN-binding protein [Paludibacter sp.]|nr:FMN-binding protein [Paludibacter sp.]
MTKLRVLVLLSLAIALSSGTINVKKKYKDGIYTGESQSRYTSEPYRGQATLEIKNDKIIKLTFQIIDKSNNEVFGPDYEQHFKNNPEYMQQCRNDLKGIKAYTEKFNQSKKLEQVDAITGATWSYNIFRDAIKVALEKAANK